MQDSEPQSWSSSLLRRRFWKWLRPGDVVMGSQTLLQGCFWEVQKGPLRHTLRMWVVLQFATQTDMIACSSDKLLVNDWLLTLAAGNLLTTFWLFWLESMGRVCTVIFSVYIWSNYPPLHTGCRSDHDRAENLCNNWEEMAGDSDQRSSSLSNSSEWVLDGV